MKLYSDVSCLDRPFDDQSQTRIRLEAAAVASILEGVERGEWRHVSSGAAVVEINAMSDVERRERVRLFLPGKEDILVLTPAIDRRGAELERLGFKAADALHAAAAEAAGADVLLSGDDRFCRSGARYRKRLRVRIANPLGWLKEIGDVFDS